MKKQQYIIAIIGVLVVISAFFAVKKLFPRSSNVEQLAEDAENLLEQIDEAA